MVPSFAFNSYGGITTTGEAWMWGHNNWGQLGDGTTTDNSSPVLVLGGHSWLQLFSVARGVTTMAIDVNGNLWSWGSNNYGIIGNGVDPGTVQAYSSPVQVAGGIKFKSLFFCNQAGQTATAYGIDDQGQVWAWGNNTDSQIGDGTALDRSSPVMVLGAHPGLLKAPSIRMEFDVIPGNPYNVDLAWAARFNGTVVGYLAKQLTVEYAQ